MNVAFKTPAELEKVERDFKTTSEFENSGTLHLNHLANRGTRLLKLLSAVQLGQSNCLREFIRWTRRDKSI